MCALLSKTADIGHERLVERGGTTAVRCIEMSRPVGDVVFSGIVCDGIARPHFEDNFRQLTIKRAACVAACTDPVACMRPLEDYLLHYYVVFYRYIERQRALFAYRSVEDVVRFQWYDPTFHVVYYSTCARFELIMLAMNYAQALYTQATDEETIECGEFDAATLCAIAKLGAIVCRDVVEPHLAAYTENDVYVVDLTTGGARKDVPPTPVELLGGPLGGCATLQNLLLARAQTTYLESLETPAAAAAYRFVYECLSAAYEATNAAIVHWDMTLALARAATAEAYECCYDAAPQYDAALRLTLWAYRSVSTDLQPSIDALFTHQSARRQRRHATDTLRQQCTDLYTDMLSLSGTGASVLTEGYDAAASMAQMINAWKGRHVAVADVLELLPPPVQLEWCGIPNERMDRFDDYLTQNAERFETVHLWDRNIFNALASSGGGGTTKR